MKSGEAKSRGRGRGRGKGRLPTTGRGRGSKTSTIDISCSHTVHQPQMTAWQQMPVLRYIDDLQRGVLDAYGEWMISSTIAGAATTLAEEYAQLLLTAIQQFNGSIADGLWLRGLCLHWSFGSAEHQQVDDDERAAFELWEEAVQTFNDPSGRSHDRLGDCYEDGHGCEEDEAKAVKLYKMGIDRGCASAAVSLGFYYDQGEGVDEEALRLYIWAHEQGNPDATYNLGAAAYADDHLDAAIKLYKHAYSRGHEDALQQLRGLQSEAPKRIVPFGRWRADAHVHMWVTAQMHRQMRTMLLVNQRLLLRRRRQSSSSSSSGSDSSAANALPQRVMQRVLFYIACRPEAMPSAFLWGGLQGLTLG